MNRPAPWIALFLSALATTVVTPACDGGSEDGTGGDGTGGATSGGGTTSTGPCRPGEVRACYSGPPETEGKLLCRPGVQTCDAGGRWSECQGELVPSDDACDLDCDGPSAAPTTCLDDTEIVARYFVDEAESGELPPTLDDAAPEPLSLDLYSAPSSDATFAEYHGLRALEWPTLNSDTNAFAPVAGTKIGAMLTGSTQLTIEAVVDVSSVDPNGSFIVYIGDGTGEGTLSLRADTSQRVSFVWKNALAGRWNALLDDRSVLHLVIDTSKPAAEAVVLYRNGAPAEVDTTAQLTLPGPNEAISFNPDDHYVLGNSYVGSRNFVGRLYYAALYGAALPAAEPLSLEALTTPVNRNAAILLVDDDRPGM